MSSQNGALNFISEGASKRKEIFAKFLDLNQFEQKYRLAKEDSAEVRAMLKKLDGRDFHQEKKDQIVELAKVTRRLNGHEEDCRVLTKQIEELNGEVTLLESTISLVPTELIDIAKPRIEKFIKQGVTTLEIKSGYGLSFYDEVKLLE